MDRTRNPKTNSCQSCLNAAGKRAQSTRLGGPRKDATVTVWRPRPGRRAAASFQITVHCQRTAWDAAFAFRIWLEQSYWSHRGLICHDFAVIREYSYAILGISDCFSWRSLGKWFSGAKTIRRRDTQRPCRLYARSSIAPLHRHCERHDAVRRARGADLQSMVEAKWGSSSWRRPAGCARGVGGGRCSATAWRGGKTTAVRPRTR